MHFFVVFPENVNIQTKLFLLGRPVPVPQNCSRNSSCSSPTARTPSPGYTSQDVPWYLLLDSQVLSEQPGTGVSSQHLGDSPCWENRTSTKGSSSTARSGCQNTEPRIHRTAVHTIFQSLQAPGSSHPINLKHAYLQGIQGQAKCGSQVLKSDFSKMSEDAECNMGSRVRETWRSRPWVGKGEWQRANTDKIFCLSWLSDHPKRGKCVKVWMQAQQRATTPANRPTGEPLQGAAVICPVLSICTLQSPRGASTQPCGTWGRAHHSQLPQPLGKLGSEI